MISIGKYHLTESAVIIKVRRRVCESVEELLDSELFFEILKRFVRKLEKKRSPLLAIFPPYKSRVPDGSIRKLVQVFQFLDHLELKYVEGLVPGTGKFKLDALVLNEFVEQLYNFWRSFNRFLVCDSKGDRLDRRPYRTFNDTTEKLMELVRIAYRDIQENLTGEHPRIYRQVHAGVEVAVIALPHKFDLPGRDSAGLGQVGVIRQILMYPPLILDPPMNKRSGRFERVMKNPLRNIRLAPEEWLCYPAKVGDLFIPIYFHQKFYGLGFALNNLFELVGEEELSRRPDAIYLFGVDPEQATEGDSGPTVFYDDERNNVLVATVPREERFGYFGYLKKMVLTLHNICMMKRSRMPFHGGLLKLVTRSGSSATILMMGDTATGKSETLEALLKLGKDSISEMLVIADDMGSLRIDSGGDVIGYGTEIGAFLRLDDLSPGYAFGQIDRAIIMSPGKTNARIVLPVAEYENVVKGHKIDMVLYANNFETVDRDHPVIEEFPDAGTALETFREGRAMSKGTTTSTGLVKSYFANIFGPPQYRELHDKIARKVFRHLYKNGVFVGQMRTRLALPGYEQKGPAAVAKEILRLIHNRGRK